MADFKGGDVVIVPMPVSPELVVWALPGPAGDVPYADVLTLVEREIGGRVELMTQLEADTVGAAELAGDAASDAIGAASAADVAAGEALTSETEAANHAGSASDSRVAAEGFASDAEGSASVAEGWATSFDLTVGDTTTVAPGANAAVTVEGTGPAYSLRFQIPEGLKGEQGEKGEVSQAQLDAAVATLVSQAPETLDTLGELAAALGGDPNFATTTSEAIGNRAKTVDVDAALADKSDVGHGHAGADVTVWNPSDPESEYPLNQFVEEMAGGLQIWADQFGVLGGQIALIGDEVDNKLDKSDAAGLSGALTDQVDVTDANVIMPAEGYPDGLAMQMGTIAGIIVDTANSLDSKANSSDLEDKIQLVTEYPASPTPGVLYVTEE